MKKTWNLSRLGSLALFGAAFIWGTSFVIMKDVTEKLPTSILIAVRFTLAFLFLSVLFLKRWKKIDRTYLFPGLLIGTLIFTAYMVQTYGLARTTPGKNAFLTASYCIMTPFLMWAFSKKRPDRYHVISALICLAGMLFISVNFSEESLLSIGIGDLLTLVCGFFYAAHIVAIAMTAQDKDPVLITILQFGVAAILSWTLFGVQSACGTAPIDLASEDVVSLALTLGYLSIMCTGVALLFQNFGQKYANPSSAAIIMTFEAVFGAAFSILLGKEQGFTVFRALGFALMFVAVILSETKLSFLRKPPANAEQKNENT